MIDASKGFTESKPAGSVFRRQRFGRFMRLVDETLQTKSICNILDVGGTASFWTDNYSLWQGRNIYVPLLNLQPERVPDERFRSLQGTACATGFADGQFDVVHSNSVIEHVGRWRDMKCMAAEVRRVAPRYFVQTPNFWFPLEAHTRFPLFQVLPEPWRVRLVQARTNGYYPRATTLDEAMAHVE